MGLRGRKKNNGEKLYNEGLDGFYASLNMSGLTDGKLRDERSTWKTWEKRNEEGLAEKNVKKNEM